MKYYVIGTRRYGGCIDEYEVLVTEDKNAAIKEARSEAYIIERDKEKYNTVEIRVYTHDIEDEDCECFDYDLVEF